MVKKIFLGIFEKILEDCNKYGRFYSNFVLGHLDLFCKDYRVMEVGYKQTSGK